MGVCALDDCWIYNLSQDSDTLKEEITYLYIGYKSISFMVAIKTDTLLICYYIYLILGLICCTEHTITCIRKQSKDNFLQMCDYFRTIIMIFPQL
jgi:hypothetical protein